MHKPSKSTTQQAVVGAGTAAMLSGLIALGSNYYSQERKNRREREERDKKNRARRQAAAERRGTDVKTTQTQIAQAEKAQLQKIPDKHLSEADQRTKSDMIKQKNQTIKANSPSTVKTMASKAAKAGKVLSPMGMFMALMSPSQLGNAEMTQADRLAEEAKRQRR